MTQKQIRLKISNVDFIYDKDYILEVLAKENPNPYEVHKIINALMQIESI